jgi:hypothetical protein
MGQFRLLRWVGLLLLLGVVLYAVASIIAEPFEQETAAELYQMIEQEGSQYQLANVLSVIGMALLLGGFYLLTRLLSDANRTVVTLGLTLFALAVVLWVAEVIGRSVITTSVAEGVVTRSEAIPTTFPQTVGVGLEPLFLAFLITALGGIALLVWSVGEAGLINALLARVGAGLTVVSGLIAAVTYPWVGGVERALFYPLVIVVLPLAILLLVRSFRRPTQVALGS